MPEVLDRYGRRKIILPPGTRIWEDLSNENKTVYYCPNGDVVEIDRLQGRIRNTTKRIDLGSIDL